MAIWAVTAREHVADQVGQRLLGFDLDAGHLGAASRSSTVLRNSSRLMPQSGFMVRMYSPTLTGWACSSSSARPGAADEVRGSGRSGFSGDLLHRLRVWHR